MELSKPRRNEVIPAGRQGQAGDPGGAVDMFGALADMVTYNGGRPLTCLA